MSTPTEIVVHCGLHKTGSTAIQIGLAKYFEACLEDGIYLYNGEGGNASHHALAAKLFRNPKKSLALIDDVVENIRKYNKHTTFISSEDFQSILTDPRSVRRFTQLLKTSGAEKVTYLIYLRNPIVYLTSMYLTLLFFKHSTPFSQYFETILDTGHYKYAKWKLHFDYAEISNALEEANVDFVFRDYHAMKDGNSVADVLDFLGHKHVSDAAQDDSRRGTTKNKGKFTKYCRYVLGDANINAQMFKEFENTLADARLELPLESKVKILERFENSLAYVDKHHGTNILRATKADIEKTQNSTSDGEGFSYFDVFHETIAEDLNPVLADLNSPKRRATSVQLMKDWGWPV